jgi:hypothetical protein
MRNEQAGSILLGQQDLGGDALLATEQAVGDEAGFRSLVAHANDQEFDFGFFRVRRIVYRFVEILDFLVGR